MDRDASESNLPAAPPPVIVCDAVQTLAVHNGVVRLTFARLNAEGRAIPALELLAPASVIGQIIKALQTIKV